MSTLSPSKNTSTRLLFSKNIRLNINSKFLPQDFFPQSISQYSKTKSNHQKQNQYLLSRKASRDSSTQDNFQFDKQVKNIQLLKKRLIKIKQSSPSSSEHDSKKKISFKKRSTSRKGQRKTIDNDKLIQNKQCDQKTKPKAYSRKLMNYMQKMKDVINIDIKFQQDCISPIYQKHSKQSVKQNPQQLETDSSPKIHRFRPKSQINSRQRLLSKQKINFDLNKLLVKPLKVKVRETNRLMRQSKQSKKQIKQSKQLRQLKQKQVKKQNDRYNKFVDINLNQQGMLTFYGNSNQPIKDSYDSKKYTARSSLPKLQK